jgi:hypothetical protein
MNHSRRRRSEGLGDITHESLSVRTNRLVETGFHYLAQLGLPHHRQTLLSVLICADRIPVRERSTNIASSLTVARPKQQGSPLKQTSE